MGVLIETEEKIKILAEKYTPEWRYDTDNPDIGSTIAKLFAEAMKENRGMLDRMIDRYHAEFINMLDISLRPAKAAGSMVIFNLMEGAVDGTYVRKGTRLLSDEEGADGNPVIFETDRDIYVTGAHLTDAFMTDREDGTISPLLGDYAPAKIVEEEELEEEEEETGEEASETEEEEEENPFRRAAIRPFVLFSGDQNISRSILVLYHESVFDIENEPIRIRISGNDELREMIGEGKLKFRYFTEKGFLEFDSVKAEDDGETYTLIKSVPNEKIRSGGRRYALVILEAEHPVTESLEADSVRLSSFGKPSPPEYVTDGTTDLNPVEFDPFSDTLSVYNECYIGHDLFFSKANSLVTVTFKTSFMEKGHYLTRQEEEVQLKIVKRKPRVLPSDIPAQAFADEISLEYFNGTGWRKLPCREDVSRIFSGETAEKCTIRFDCPADWSVAESGAYQGRCIRMRLMKSDNCYLRPGIHHYPRISDLKVSFSYEENTMEPQKVFTVSGTKKTEITEQMKRKGAVTVFHPGDYTDDALYLGFDRKIEDGPVSLYFGLQDTVNQNIMPCRYEYSSTRGFRQMKVVDHTGDFSRSGIVMFVPPSDFHATELEGKRRYWIRLVRARYGAGEDNPMFFPRIESITVNVVPVSNTITGSEQNFYIDDPEPNMHFSLGTRNILDAEVWVNEKGSITREEGERLLSEFPDRVNVEYNVLGEISAFYVKWTEADSFLNLSDRRCYRLDRLSNEIVFSDSVKADIPRVTDDVAFKVTTRTSDGSYGNVERETINETAGAGLYIDTVTNPVRAYGGSGMETVQEALRRGANILHGRNRLVSVDDYIWTILNFSNSIDKVLCIPGKTIDGTEDPADLSFVLLMKDYAEGSFSFQRIASSLKKELLRSSELTVSEERLHITEPIFVSVSVNVWAQITGMDDSFETQNMILQVLEDFFNPIASENGSGWEIGVMPKRTQILMKLGALKGRAMIHKTSIVASYRDHTGEHETDLSELKASPFMVVRSGKHQVHTVLH